MRMPPEFEQSKHTYVFGSNELGVHGAGAAKTALTYYGAVYGKGIGFHGQSYAIPTKDTQIRTLPIEKIKVYVDEFIGFARAHPDMLFYVTPIGTGLAGYSHAQMAPLFQDAPANCWMIQAWHNVNNP